MVPQKVRFILCVSTVASVNVWWVSKSQTQGIGLNFRATKNKIHCAPQISKNPLALSDPPPWSSQHPTWTPCTRRLHRLLWYVCHRPPPYKLFITLSCITGGQRWYSGLPRARRSHSLAAYKC
ncbi:hypothetical protein PF002_g21502 [Phytophthora fragariae]|uniref:Secreted protein n=1 Tax=Phytophthora fragariae TaxID=53985 RepID=A0A6A3XQD8_9STRA|nr:hypothetical protein PF003_g24625 [Phytophthora fragariae]KAE9088925.1 hypothetical protein PF007_g19792 [Phytophthora fragariae]KAE9201536.1 hypothetical protein PF002_g21502 [Phytophthora fragariae]KAE9288221.1 hypothetical protein PF001_g20622 [Phytophthora fragariae]